MKLCKKNDQVYMAYMKESILEKFCMVVDMSPRSFLTALWPLSHIHRGTVTKASHGSITVPGIWLHVYELQAAE